MQTDMQKIISQSFAIKLSLDDLDQDNVKNRSIPGCHANSSVDRVRIFVTNGLRQRLSGFLSDFSAFQKKVRDDHRDDVRRRVFTVTGKLVSEESVNKMIESGEAETFLRKAIEGQGKSNEEKMKAMVRQIEDENASVRKLEESLLALQNIFLQMSVLVQMQGAELNDIERNMLEAMSYISAGVTDLESAADKKKSTNRCWVIAVVIVVLLVLAGVAVLLVCLFVL
ncbi:hypothetical protein KP509_12G056500 [Ceratopteris richardii]|nr:hypothetical protein KP509_12G056500 [Ceratopteris richardii]